MRWWWRCSAPPITLPSSISAPALSHLARWKAWASSTSGMEWECEGNIPVLYNPGYPAGRAVLHSQYVCVQLVRLRPVLWDVMSLGHTEPWLGTRARPVGRWIATRCYDRRQLGTCKRDFLNSGDSWEWRATGEELALLWATVLGFQLSFGETNENKFLTAFRYHLKELLLRHRIQCGIDGRRQESFFDIVKLIMCYGQWNYIARPELLWIFTSATQISASCDRCNQLRGSAGGWANSAFLFRFMLFDSQISPICILKHQCISIISRYCNVSHLTKHCTVKILASIRMNYLSFH